MSECPFALSRLPLAQHHEEILERLKTQTNLLLTAPTGTGKSSYLPWLLHQGISGQPNPQRIAVLQPRRIAALSLCNFLARCMGEESGATVGYSFRFESKQSARTQILFQTYGSFLQQALRDQAMPYDWVVFDEFHERRTEMDLLLSWFLAWQKEDPAHAPRLAVLSAELNRALLEKWMEIPCVRVESPGYPVQILHMEAKPSEPMDSQVLRAVRTLQGNNIWNTTLVFLPGKSEIQNCANLLEETLGKSPEPPLILKLFGGQEVVEQVQIFADIATARIILTTNIAETSLTVPQVTAVIDSGYERSTEYDFVRNIQVLRLNRIAMQNAVQRTGRAGRTRPGVCIRLWGERDEMAMPREVIPEIQRSRLQVPLLLRAALAHKLKVDVTCVPWFSAPRADQELLANQELVRLGFLAHEGRITPQGLLALQVPVQSLEVAKMLLDSPNASKLLLACAAWIDAGNEVAGPAQESRNLMDLAGELAQERRGAPREISMQFERLKDWSARRTRSTPPVSDTRAALESMLRAFPNALATLAETRKAYRLADETAILLDPKQTGNSSAVLAFHLLRSGSGKLQQISRCIFAAIPPELLHQGQEVEDHWELLWRNGQERFTGLCVRRQGERELERFDCAPQDATPAARKTLVGLTAAAWADKFTREDLSHNWMGDHVTTLLAKMKWAEKLFPEYQLPTWSADDWALVMDEFTSGIFLLRDLDEQRFRHVVEEYFGRNMLPWLHKTFPDTIPMPSGRMGKYLIPDPEVGPIELSARISDFLGMQGEHWIAEKRLKVRYDLLAPNYRSVQKTWDLTGFWTNTYAEVRKELRGRYPRHPWPENPMA